MNKGDLQYRAEMYDFALESYEKVLDRNKNSFKAANMLAKISLMKNKKQQALRWFLLSLKINNNQADIHYKTGELYDFFADYDKSYYHYIESIKINKNHILSNMALVRFYHKRKNFQKAQMHFTTSRRAAIKFMGEKLKEAYSYEEKNPDKAVKLYKLIILKAPSLTRAHENLFNLYRKKGHYLEAAKVMEHLKFIKPDHEKAFVFLGHLYFNRKLGGNSRAFYLRQSIKNLKRAHQLNPENTETLLTLARVYYYIKKPLLAKEIMKRVAKIEESK